MATPTNADPLLYHFDDVIVDCEKFRVQKGDQARTLSPRSFDLLVYLIEHRNRVVEKQELFEQIWKESFVTDNALTRAVKDIRRAIGDDADAPRYVETVPKRGYRFIADIKTPDENSQLLNAADSQEKHVAATVLAQEPVRPEMAREAGAASRTSGLKIIAYAVVCAAAAIAALVIWKNQTGSGSTDIVSVVSSRQITNWSGLDIDPALSPDENSIAYSSDHSGSFEIYVKPLTPGAREIQLTSDGEQNFEPAWSPDGKLIAYYSKNRGGIWLVPASGGTVKQLTEFGSSPVWSPDGYTIAFQSHPVTELGATNVGMMPPSTIWIAPSEGGDPKPITQVGNPPGGHGVPSWSADGKRIIFVASDGIMAAIYTVSAGGDDLKQIIASRNWLYDPIYSPDGKYIYYGGISELGNFVMYRLRISPATGDAAGEPLEVENTGLGRIKDLTISADGKRLVYSAPTMKSSLSSAPISPGSSEAAGDPAPLTQDTSYRKAIPSFSPDGRKIAYTEFRGGANPDIWVMDADGKNPVQLTNDPAIDWAPNWFPDNDQIAFQSNRQGKQMVWSISTRSGRERLLLDPGQDISFPKLSPDGKQVAFNSINGGTINIWTASIEGGQPVQLTSDEETMGWPCWSPDGRLIALQMKRGDDTHVMVMPSGGGAPTQLTFDRGQSWLHSWSPDGDKIAFAGFRNGYWNVYWVSLSTKKQKQITNYKKLNAYIRFPAWAPLGDRIVYEYAETVGNIWMMELK
ncbi:MAG TPA: winged helix-turn-helix domain-containing protein [Blastocatellia bacterium]|nr:winged helix-turn-helix domain-containing protein [Blastocatellia bacterium]